MDHRQELHNLVWIFIVFSTTALITTVDSSFKPEWKGKIYFDPQADKSGSPIYQFKNDLNELSKLKELVDPTEKIILVEIYRHPLNSIQVINNNLYHAFVFFETDGWWWSIEKNVISFFFSKK